MIKKAVALLFIISLVSCNQHKVKTHANPLLGSWKMQKVTWISKERSHPIDKTQPGIFLFTSNSYSIQWTPTTAPRVPFKLLSKPTNAEIIAGFGSVIFNAGSYDYTDTTVTATSFIAKVPGFEGGKQFYTYAINEDILTLTMFDETYPNNTKPEWSGKWKTEFILKRVLD